eukprot:371428-Rhodomonas_salina.1
MQTEVTVTVAVTAAMPVGLELYSPYCGKRRSKRDVTALVPRSSLVLLLGVVVAEAAVQARLVAAYRIHKSP